MRERPPGSDDAVAAAEAPWPVRAPAERATGGVAPVARIAIVAIGSLMLAPAVVSAIAGPMLLDADPFAMVAAPFAPPSLSHPFGTDDLGRDLFAGVVHGARTSLIVGGIVGSLALLLGLAIGALAGYFGGRLDDILMRITELFQVIPRFFLAVVVLALFGHTLVNLVVVLAATSWGGLARIARGEILSLREREFVRAARALGAGPATIILRHVVPHALAPVLAMTIMIVSTAILTEASLGYLGFSDPDLVSWGQLLNNAQSFFDRGWWLALCPGLAIVVTIVGLFVVVEATRR
jgi:peptide/nickel transport system permease protein